MFLAGLVFASSAHSGQSNYFDSNIEALADGEGIVIIPCVKAVSVSERVVPNLYGKP